MRQLRKHHPDSRYVSVILQYVKALACIIENMHRWYLLTINALFQWEAWCSNLDLCPPS